MNTNNEKEEAISTLLTWLQPGETVYTVLRHVSASGMLREISLVVFKIEQSNQQESPSLRRLDITRKAAAACGFKLNKDETAIVVRGIGMDMGFSLVSELEQTMWKNGESLRHAWI